MKIDFVIPWVDGSDEEWLAEKAKHLPVSESDKQRFRDWDLLKYWFRGIETYAPWVNKIHFVTWGHVPDFLDVNHPKINIVKHEDFIDKEYLPTFNANTIELNMHKIEGLSEHFVYFNDDTYLIKPVEVNDFFDNGLPKDVAILNPIVPKYFNSISNMMANDIAIINQNFKFRESFKRNKFKWINFKYGRLLPLNFLFLPWSSVIGLYQQHLPASFLKSTFTKVWEKEFDVLHQTSLDKNRNNFTDVNQWLIKEWQVMSGNFSPRSINFGKYIMIKDESDVLKFKIAKNTKSVKIVCLNDHVHSNYDEIIEQTTVEFEAILGNKSQFER